MYIALYRKWRPKKFEEICGQEHITITLQNQIKSNRISHAYLFCGTRGTGKTTTAKLLSKAVNCFQPIDDNPCDNCPSCKGISDGSSIDVFEIDAASNRGIDNIRDLRDTVKFTPSLGRYKVYIIDEVHMLTNEAFNALLKTLEEPPEYVIFILATTEPHKLPATVLSRCQRFDFKRVSQNDMLERLLYICKQEAIEADEEALRLIIRNTDGAMRDAISMMDQCSIYGNKKITLEDVSDVLSIVNDKYLFQLADIILAEDISKAMSLLKEISEEGKDISQFARDLLMHYRNLLMAKLMENPEGVIDLSQESILRLKEQSLKHTRENIIRCIKILQELVSEMKWSPQPRLLQEIALIKMCRLEKDMSNEGLLARIAKLEKAVSQGEISIVSLPRIEKDNKNTGLDKIDDNKPLDKADETSEKQEILIKDEEIREEEETDKDIEGIEEEMEKKSQTDSRVINQEILEKWNGFIDEIKKKKKMALRTHLALCKPKVLDGKSIILCFDDSGSFSKEAVEKHETKNQIEKMAEEYFGIPLRIKSVFEDEMNDDNKDEGDELCLSEDEDSIEDMKTMVDGQYVLDKAIEVFGEDLVETSD